MIMIKDIIGSMQLRNKINRYILAILLLTGLPVIAFTQRPIADLSTVDSFASTVKYEGDLTKLTKELTDPYPEQLFKARAIFKWITDNIRYDHKFYNKYFIESKEFRAYKCKSEKDCDAKRIVWETKYIDGILRKRKAICDGYSKLFKKMCDVAGLKSEYIHGYIRTKPYQVGTAGTLDHAWNAVQINDTWYVMDVTWAAGTCPVDKNEKYRRFKKVFNNYYWLTPPEDFVRNHFPKKAELSLLPGYTKDKFAKNPYYEGSVLSRIKLITPDSGVLSAKKGDTIRFKIEYKGNLKDLQINSNFFRNPDIYVVDERSKRKQLQRIDSLALKKQRYVQYKREGDVYEFEYVVPENSLYYLEILFDRQRVLRFKVNS